MPHQSLLNFQIHFVLSQQARVSVPKRMPSNTPNSGCDPCRNQMIFTNLIGPIRIARLRIRENPFGINFIRSFSVLPKNHG